MVSTAIPALHAIERASPIEKSCCTDLVEAGIAMNFFVKLC
jgi:hypothetical protein